MARYLIGVVMFAVAFGALGVGVRALRRAFMPQARGSVAWLTDLCMIAVSVVLVTQLLGLLTIYRLSTVFVLYTALGLGLYRLAPRVPERLQVTLAPAAPSVFGRTGRLLSVIAVAGGLGPWIVRSSVGLTSGIPGADTLWYHLPGAAKLVQTGSLQTIQHFDGGRLTAYYPNGATFFHSTGMVFFESDIASTVMNLGWACLLLLAAWAVGRPLGVSHGTLIAGVVTISFPGFVGHEGGSAMTDVAVLALIVSAVALLVNARPDRLTDALPIIALAGALAGAALGSKWTAIPAAGAITLAVIAIAPRGRRSAIAATWLVASGATGLLTYVRNFIVIGNPLPPKTLSLGPLTLDSVADESTDQSIADWILADHHWSEVFVPGLELWFGPLWVLPLLGSIVALALGVVFSSGRLYRLAAFVGAVAFIGYIIAPVKLELFGAPLYFVSGVRYGILGLGLGLILLPTLRLFRGRAAWLPMTLLLAILGSSLLTPRTWTGIGDWRFQENVDDTNVVIGVIGAVVILLLGLVLVERRSALPSFNRLLGTGAAIAALASVIGFSSYTDARYAEKPFWNPAVDLTDERIAVDGLNLQYNLYGDDLSNHVQWIGTVDDGVFNVAANCRQWADLVNDGNYGYVVVGVLTGTDRAYEWTKNDPAATVLQDVHGVVNIFGQSEPGAEAIAVFELTGPLDPSRCEA